MRLTVRAYALVVAAYAGSSSACVEDVVLPPQGVSSVCGNGVLEPGEDCDATGPGCVACAVTPLWTCTRAGCSPTCGDGVVGDDAACANPRRETDCDMTGYWVVRQSTYLREAVLASLQVSSDWFLLRLVHEAHEPHEPHEEGRFRVVEAIDCGIFVTGFATVRYTQRTLGALVQTSGMAGGDGRLARQGVSRPVAGGCAVSFDRWYAVRGATAAYLPTDPLAKPDLSALPPLPFVADPTTSNPPIEGALDLEGDGHPGVSFQIDGLVSGVRNSAQRDWKEYATKEGAPAPPRALTFDVPGAFDLQESVLHVGECGKGCGLLSTVARVANEIPARMTFAYVGRELSGPRVRQIARRALGAEVAADLSTCTRARALIPHDPSAPGAP